MTIYLQKLLFITLALLSSTMLFSLCGCARMNGMVMNESGQAYYQRGNYTMARKEFQKAMIDDPTNAHYAFNLAAASQKQGDYAVAEQGYRQALSLDPSYQPAYHGLASMMVEQGRPGEAQQLLTAWAGSQPYAAESHVEMAWLHRELGDVQSAEQSLRHALKINPQHDKAIAQLGQVYEEQGRSQDAVAMYQRSLYLDPTQSHVKSRMAALEDQHIGHQQSYGGGSPSMMAGMPLSAPMMMNSPQMATQYPTNVPAMGQYQPTYPEAIASGYGPQSPYPPQATPVAGTAFPSGMAPYSTTGQPMMIGQWEAQPTMTPSTMPPSTMSPSSRPMLAPPSVEPMISSQPATLVVPPTVPTQTGAMGVPQVSQNIPEVSAF